jgi:hypothetical protein
MADEPAQKKARQEEGSTGESYYKQIDGVKYARDLIEMAEAFAKDGQVSYPEANALWQSALDGQGVTDTEKLTLEYTMKTLKYTDKAKKFMREQLDSGKKQSYYKQIDNVKYCRDLLETAEAFAKDGRVSEAEAKSLWDQAQDGKGVTETEARTLEYTMTAFNYTDKAAKFMKRSLAGDKKASYYKQIDGVKYDRELLEQAEAFQKDGQISHAEAKQLWEDALDGKGVTATEKRTLEYTMTHFKYTDKASDFMKKALGANVSYYKQIDGVKYDRELLELAESLAKDGQISHEDAGKLLESAKDGKGITEIEKGTLKHAMATLKFTDKAIEFLKAELEK